MSTEDTPKPAAWTFGSSYWTKAESIPLAIIAQAKPLYDQATLDAAVAEERERCVAIARTMRIKQAIPDSEESSQDWCARYIEGEILGWPEEGANVAGNRLAEGKSG